MSASNNNSHSPYVDKLDKWSSHAWICHQLMAFPAKSEVLDIGTATGMLGRRCSDGSLHLYGIELNPEWAKIASPYYKDLFCGSLDDAPDAFLRNRDVIVLADVIEHMPDSEGALVRLASLQSNNATFIISVPNIANIRVRLNLLFGRFDYTDRGILDRTHLRFFTRKTLLELLSRSGLEVKQFAVTPVPLNLVHPFFENSWLGKLIFNGLGYLTPLFPTILGYQLITVCQKVAHHQR